MLAHLLERFSRLIPIQHVKDERHVCVVRTTEQLSGNHVTTERPISEEGAEELSRVEDGDGAVDSGEVVARALLLLLALLLLQQLRTLSLPFAHHVVRRVAR